MHLRIVSPMSWHELLGHESGVSWHWNILDWIVVSHRHVRVTVVNALVAIDALLLKRSLDRHSHWLSLHQRYHFKLSRHLVHHITILNRLRQENLGNLRLCILSLPALLPLLLIFVFFFISIIPMLALMRSTPLVLFDVVFPGLFECFGNNLRH